MSTRTLVRGGHVLTMDPAHGDIHCGDVLVEGERIVAVGTSIDAEDAEILDASGCIVIPGFIDSHRHTWETVIRGIAPDVSLSGYFDIVLDRVAAVGTQGLSVLDRGAGVPVRVAIILHRLKAGVLSDSIQLFDLVGSSPG